MRFPLLPLFFSFCLAAAGAAAGGNSVGPGATPGPEAPGALAGGYRPDLPASFRLDLVRPLQLGLAKLAVGNGARAAVARQLLGVRPGMTADEIVQLTQEQLAALPTHVQTLEQLDEYTEFTRQPGSSASDDLGDRLHRLVLLHGTGDASLKKDLDKHMRSARAAAGRLLRLARFDGEIPLGTLQGAVRDFETMTKASSFDYLHDNRGSLRSAALRAGRMLMKSLENRANPEPGTSGHSASAKEPPRPAHRAWLPPGRTTLESLWALTGQHSESGIDAPAAARPPAPPPALPGIQNLRELWALNQPPIPPEVQELLNLQREFKVTGTPFDVPALKNPRLQLGKRNTMSVNEIVASEGLEADVRDLGREKLVRHERLALRTFSPGRLVYDNRHNADSGRYVVLEVQYSPEDLQKPVELSVRLYERGDLSTTFTAEGRAARKSAAAPKKPRAPKSTPLPLEELKRLIAVKRHLAIKRLVLPSPIDLYQVGEEDLFVNSRTPAEGISFKDMTEEGATWAVKRALDDRHPLWTYRPPRGSWDLIKSDLSGFVYRIKGNPNRELTLTVQLSQKGGKSTVKSIQIELRDTNALVFEMELEETPPSKKAS